MRNGMGPLKGIRVVEFAGIGHAPMLMEQSQIATVREFLAN